MVRVVNKFENQQSVFSVENFISAKYFNESMINKMKIEHELLHASQKWKRPVQFGCWNSTGILLACGKPQKGVQVFTPFRNFEATCVPVQRDHRMTDAVFMPKHPSSMVVSSRNLDSYLYSSESKPDDYVKVWDVEAGVLTRKYRMKGVVKKLATSTSLPDHFWFNVDRNAQKLAETDTRTASLNIIKLGKVQRQPSFINWRSFDVNPVDEKTIAVGDLSKLVLYDRRMTRSSAESQPTKIVDISPLNTYDSFLVNVKYNPGGDKLILTSSLSFNIHQYVVPAAGPSVRNMRPLLLGNHTAAVTKNPSFLGENHLLFDTEFRNYAVVFNLEDARHVGNINILGNKKKYSSSCNMPHPTCCLIASASKNKISFISPALDLVQY